MKKRKRTGFNWHRLIIIVLALGVIYPAFFVLFPSHLTDMHFKGNLLASFVSILADFVLFTIAVWLIWDYNNKFVKYLEGKVRWERHPFKRLFYQSTVTAAMDFVILAVSMIPNLLISWIAFPSIMEKIHQSDTQGLFLQVLFYFIAIFIIYNFIYISIFFYSRWVNSLLESEKLKFENLHAQLHALQNQVNPHFLFNSLNTLTSIIEDDKKTAIEFVQQLSSFYRYLLQRQSSHLVPLKDELNFLSSYIYLQRKRFGNNFEVELNLEKEIVKKTVPTFALQLLLENVFKHNIVSSEKPLKVLIYSLDGCRIAVENNLQKKQHIAVSTEHGLQNIKNRCEILGGKEIEITETDSIFRVIIPLFEEKSQNEYFDN